MPKHTWLEIGKGHNQVSPELAQLLEEKNIFPSENGFMLIILKAVLASVSLQIETTDYSHDKNYGTIVPIEFTIQSLLSQIPEVNPLIVKEHPLVGVYIRKTDQKKNGRVGVESGYTLSTRTFNTLTSEAINSVMGLIHAPDLARLSDANLLAIDGIGQKSVEEIKTLLLEIEQDIEIDS